MKKLPEWIFPYTLFAFLIVFIPRFSSGQTTDTLTTAELKSMNLEELMQIEVTSVSKRPENLLEVASAVYVITQEDIRNSGSKTLPEVLRLAPNLQVAQVNASQWAISSRGFNNVLSNKLLVLIDGRTVYTPLYGGVFWDVQNLILADVDRIEVISGPGGTLWGANAVNGVINIITKHTSETQGLLAEGAYGTDLQAMVNLRYGGNIKEKFHYRMYSMGYKLDNTLLFDGSNAQDEWVFGQGGILADWEISPDDDLHVQANYYASDPNPDGDTLDHLASGDNVLARWSHRFSEKSALQLQAYYDHTFRDFGNGLEEDLKTYDIEVQKSTQLGQRHTLTVGGGFRYMEHNVSNLDLFVFLPARKELYLYNGFLQYEFVPVLEKLRFILGSKVEYNTYTQYQYQPNARISWTPTDRHSFWTAASRAVRNPTRLERELTVFLLPGFPFLSGSQTFRSEEVWAYELGWRYQPVQKLFGSVSLFYNLYDHLRTAEPGPPPLNLPVTLANGVEGETYGVELSSRYTISDRAQLMVGYTYLEKDLRIKPTSNDLNQGTTESNDPQHQVLAQATYELPLNFEISTVARYVSALPMPYVVDYTGLDIRIGWTYRDFLELNVVGQNLLYEHHKEFIPSSPAPRLLERSVYGKITLRF